MRYAITVLIFVVSALTSGLSFAQSISDEDELSRQDLFSIIQSTDNPDSLYALPPSFTFPKDARDTSTFGIDFSHHVVDKCKCDINWKAIAEQRVRFVYLKATQGASFDDASMKPALESIRKLGPNSIDVGIYHFLTASESADDQKRHFSKVIKEVGHLQLPPSIDLEWDAGPYDTSCPADAVMRFRKTDGSIKLKCDRWSLLSAAEIILKTNEMLDSVREATNQDAVLYTSAVWWKSRIGSSTNADQLHTKLIWIADYSKSGLATERPRTVDKSWDLWQFSESAELINQPTKVLMDASIFDGDLASMRQRLNVKR